MATKRFAIVLLIILVPFLAACATGPVGQRATQGAVLGAMGGAAVGGLIGGGKGAAAGALIGGLGGAAVGAAVGSGEAKTVFQEPQPLPWLSGKSIQVVGARSYGYGVDVSRPVIEDQLRRRGAVVVDNPGPQYYPRGQDAVATDFIAEASAIEKAGAVVMDIRVLDSSSRQVRAIGSAAVRFGYGGYTGDYRVEALRSAAKNAVWALH